MIYKCTEYIDTCAHRGINWFECAPTWCEKVDLKQFEGLTYPWRRLLCYFKSQIILKFKNLSLNLEDVAENLIKIRFSKLSF